MTDEIQCFSCPSDFPFPATEIATVPHRDGDGKIAFGAPLCSSHAQMALVAGWFPIFDLDSAEGKALWDAHGWMNPRRTVPTHNPDRAGKGEE